MKFIFKFKYMDILSLVVFFACFELAFINQLIGLLIWGIYAIRWILIVICTVACMKKKQKFSRTICIITIYLIYIAIITCIKGGGISTFVWNLSTMYLVVLYLDVFYRDRDSILNVWNICLWVAVLLNILSLVAFPNGMSKGYLYSNVWFLGYKTQQYVYLLPWCLSTAYLSARKTGKLNALSYITVLISCAILRKADSTAAMVCTLLLAVLYLVTTEVKRAYKQNAGQKLYKLFNYKVLIPVVAVSAFLVIMIERFEFVSLFVVNVLNKDATLTTRTGIWGRLLVLVKESPVFGNGYLTSAQYVAAAKNMYATNAHSMYMSILVVGGVVGCLIYAWIVAESMRRSQKTYMLCEVVMIFGIISFAVVGMTSSTFIFCPYNFFCYALLAADKRESEAMLSPEQKKRLRRFRIKL